MNTKLSQIWSVARRLERERLDPAAFACIAAFIESFDVNVADEVLQEYFWAYEQDYLNEELLTLCELCPRELKIQEVMSEDVISVESGISLKEACGRLTTHAVSSFPVVDEDGKLIGVFATSDVVQTLAGRDEVEGLTVGDVMTSHSLTTRADSGVAELLHLMVAFQLPRAVVVDRGERPVGIVTTFDMTCALKRLLSHGMKPLPLEPELLFLN